MSEPAIYSVAEYEDGWYVEKSDPIAPLHDCKFIQDKGPFKSEAEAVKCASKMNSLTHHASGCECSHCLGFAI